MLAQVVHLDIWRAILTNYGEGPVDHILSYASISRKLGLFEAFEYLFDFRIAENVK